MIDNIIQDGITMVPKYAFETVIRHKEEIDKVVGEIVECGVWKGGFSIFLAKTFPTRAIWVCDSFQGFQPLLEADYYYESDRHIPSVEVVKSPLTEVRSNFSKYGLADDSRITYLEGFVKDTLRKDICKIGTVAILRIDVDAYSATLEVLDNLYSKVAVGGYIIFDDSCLQESLEAIKFFFSREGLPMEVLHPETDEKLDLLSVYTNDDSGFPQGCYIVKK